MKYVRVTLRLNPFISQVNYWLPEYPVEPVKYVDCLNPFISQVNYWKCELDNMLYEAHRSLNPFISQVNYWEKMFVEYGSPVPETQSLHKSGQLLVTTYLIHTSGQFMVSIPS